MRAQGAFVKLLCRYLQDIGGHVTLSMLAKWVNVKSHPSYGDDTYGQVKATTVIS